MFLDFDFFQYQLLSLQNIGKGILLLIPVIYFYHNYQKKQINAKCVKDLNTYLNRKNQTNNILNFLKGVWFLGVGLYIWFYYRPNKTQRTLNLLVTELLKSNLLDPKFKIIYNKLNPTQMYIS